MPEIGFEDLVAGLRAAVAGSTAHEQAAVELLIWHANWLRRGRFREACISHRGGQLAIRWHDARTFSDRVTAGGLGVPRASSSEAAILDLAVALGEDRFRLASFGHVHKAAVAYTVAAAMGLADPVVPKVRRIHNHPDFIPCDETCPAREAANDA